MAKFRIKLEARPEPSSFWSYVTVLPEGVWPVIRQHRLECTVGLKLA